MERPERAAVGVARAGSCTTVVVPPPRSPTAPATPSAAPPPRSPAAASAAIDVSVERDIRRASCCVPVVIRSPRLEPGCGQLSQRCEALPGRGHDVERNGRDRLLALRTERLVELAPQLARGMELFGDVGAADQLAL